MVQKSETNQIYWPQTCCNILLVWKIYSVRLNDCSRVERKEESTVRVLPILRIDIRYQVRECQQKSHLHIWSFPKLITEKNKKQKYFLQWILTAYKNSLKKGLTGDGSHKMHRISFLEIFCFIKLSQGLFESDSVLAYMLLVLIMWI